LKGLGTDFRIFDAEENFRVLRDLKTRILKITYQAFSKTDFSPISVEPKGINLFRDYTVIYEERIKKLSKVHHRTDGIVLFEGVKDRGEFGLWDGEPIEIYTICHDDYTHRIVHLHLNDIREDIAIDAVNITGTGKKATDFKELKKDTTGRFLSYRVIVNNQKVAAIYHHSGKTAKAKFIEISLPAIGSLVAIERDDKRSTVLGTLMWAPTGMVVSTKENSEVESKQKASYPHATFSRCLHKHPIELPGMVDVRLEVDLEGNPYPEMQELKEQKSIRKESSPAGTSWGESTKTVEIKSKAAEKDRAGMKERYVSVPICRLFPASSEQINSLHEKRKRVLESKKDELVTMMTLLESLARKIESGSSSIDEDLKEMESLRTRVTELNKEDYNKGVVDARRIANISRSMRYAALQRRLSKKESKSK